MPKMHYYNFCTFLKRWIIYSQIILISMLLFPLISSYLECNLICETVKFHPKQKKIDNSCESFSKEEVDTVNFNPIDGEGAMGKGVIIPSEQTAKMKKLFKINNFNLLASDRISLNRTLTDVRMVSCRLRKYPEDLPNTSIVIIFHNEAWSALLRTIWSIITRTPKKLLKEIILIDDASEREFLKRPLDEYIKKIPISIKIIRMPKRKGIVSARLAGADAAIGDVLTFFDAHCECSEGWAEPLLARIKEDRNTIICPIIDQISIDDFSYIETDINRFFWVSWNLGFSMGINNVSDDKLIKSPIMAGGIYSIDRKYFFEIGTYDSKMQIWGGENIEMSFRVWQCGGQIEIHPCSHVGHVNRLVPPYSYPNGEPMKTVLSNLDRTALVWMDEWSDFYFLYNSLTTENYHNRNRINVTDRLNLRKRLNCKSFSWYLKNIWPDNFFPADNRFFGKIIWLQEKKTELIKTYKEFLYDIIIESVPTKWSDIIQKLLQNINKFTMRAVDYKTNFCLRPHINTSLYSANDTFTIVGDCVSDITLQDNLVITDDGLIMTNGYNCLNLNPIWSKSNIFLVLFSKCYINSKIYWVYDIITQRIFQKGSDLCLTVEEDQVNGQYFVTAKSCNIEYGFYQKWGLIPQTWKTEFKK